jgi:hypothetical protein
MTPRWWYPGDPSGGWVIHRAYRRATWTATSNELPLASLPDLVTETQSRGYQPGLPPNEPNSFPGNDLVDQPERLPDADRMPP